MYMMKFKQVKRVAFATVNCFEQVQPQVTAHLHLTTVWTWLLLQLVLFWVVFYGFAHVGHVHTTCSTHSDHSWTGMGLFAGCVTEVTSNGGPGDWSTSPWSSTAFGGAPFYYSNLNFDNLHSALTTLFMLMVQNNWYVRINAYLLHVKLIFFSGKSLSMVSKNALEPKTSDSFSSVLTILWQFCWSTSLSACCWTCKWRASLC